jgi:hypothetical protein
LAVQGEVARIRIRGRSARNPYFIQLAPNTRTKIEHHIDRIRDAIEASDLPDWRKEVLHAKLDDLIAELDKRRVGFGRTMAVLSAVLVALASATTIAAEGPNAVANIMKLLAIDKESENAARLRLAPPEKALAAPQNPTEVSDSQAALVWDPPRPEEDEIPF